MQPTSSVGAGLPAIRSSVGINRPQAGSYKSNTVGINPGPKRNTAGINPGPKRSTAGINPGLEHNTAGIKPGLEHNP